MKLNESAQLQDSALSAASPKNCKLFMNALRNSVLQLVFNVILRTVI
jgi:hypothetical protein